MQCSTKQQIHNSDILQNDYSSTRYDSLWKTPLSRHESKTNKQLNPVEESIGEKKGDIPNKKMRHISLHLIRNINKLAHKHCIHINDSTGSDNKSKSIETNSAHDNAATESTLKTTVTTSKNSKKLSGIRQHGGSGSVSSIHIYLYLIYLLF